MTDYTISKESFVAAWPEIEPLARMHFEETRARFATEGMPMGAFNPRLDVYKKADEGEYLHTFVVRTETGQAVGHSTVYIQTDMHNRELIGKEDTIYIHPDHRNGVGRRLTKHILLLLKSQGVFRATIDARTDP
ncbi:GNAT family N-acetyltransferase, partial [Mesorhizobium sp. B2-6-7]|uniref:GNAT family N-acetyltransferase n=1 Tax=Mesorhizobium sp. B2-6-7 TaxID=2589910 RepID=UPI001126955B